MKAVSDRRALRPIILWGVLVAITLFSWKTAVAERWIADPRLVATAVIILTFVKVRIVLLDFMDVRYAPVALRTAIELWVIVVGLLLTGAYWMG